MKKEDCCTSCKQKKKCESECEKRKRDSYFANPKPWQVKGSKAAKDRMAKLRKKRASK